MAGIALSGALTLIPLYPYTPILPYSDLILQAIFINHPVFNNQQKIIIRICK